MAKKRKDKRQKKSGGAKGAAKPAGSMALMARNVLSLLKSYPEQAFSIKQLLKEEMWYVLQADAGAELISGFSRNTSANEVMQLLYRECLFRVAV